MDVLDTLAKKVDPGHAALIVVDVQNDFCAPEGMMDREGNDLTAVRAMVPRLHRLVDAAREAGVFVVFIQSIYGLAGNELLSESWLEQAARRRKGSYTEYAVCADGSWNFDFYGDLRPVQGEPIIHKHRFSAFEGTELDLILRSKGVRSVILTGVATNVCVETTARHAFVKDYYVVFVGDCTGTYSQDEQAMTLRNMDRYFGQVVTHDEVIACWEGAGTLGSAGAEAEAV
jgi:ureidoacrylate peracid hydrolase